MMKEGKIVYQRSEFKKKNHNSNDKLQFSPLLSAFFFFFFKFWSSHFL